jgi:hypothetical protein
MELILEQVELGENTVNENTFDIFYDANTKRIHAFENTNTEESNPREYIFELIGEQDYIAKTHREEILKYCLSKVTPDDEVSLGDIFLHGKFIKLIQQCEQYTN